MKIIVVKNKRLKDVWLKDTTGSNTVAHSAATKTMTALNGEANTTQALKRHPRAHPRYLLIGVPTWS